jgi:hypothetical protein
MFLFLENVLTCFCFVLIGFGTIRSTVVLIEQPHPTPKKSSSKLQQLQKKKTTKTNNNKERNQNKSETDVFYIL